MGYYFSASAGQSNWEYVYNTVRAHPTRTPTAALNLNPTVP